MKTMRSVLPVLGWLALAGGCYSSGFVRTGEFTPQAREPDSVRVVLTPKPTDASLREVGVVTASGAGFEGALARARNEAGRQGCDVLAVVSESVESGRNTPGSAFGMTRSHLRCSCLVRLARQSPQDPAPIQAQER
jgi:hypothetical protein